MVMRILFLLWDVRLFGTAMSTMDVSSSERGLVLLLGACSEPNPARARLGAACVALPGAGGGRRKNPVTMLCTVLSCCLTAATPRIRPELMLLLLGVLLLWNGSECGNGKRVVERRFAVFPADFQQLAKDDNPKTKECLFCCGERERERQREGGRAKMQTTMQ